MGTTFSTRRRFPPLLGAVQVDDSIYRVKVMHDCQLNLCSVLVSLPSGFYQIIPVSQARLAPSAACSLGLSPEHFSKFEQYVLALIDLLWLNYW